MIDSGKGRSVLAAGLKQALGLAQKLKNFKVPRGTLLGQKFTLTLGKMRKSISAATMFSE
jgi:hypothetical protein